MSEKVVTRFAPSPTGFLHIGGARTALFNWLFARHHGGKFLLRVEDTDRKRSTKEAVDAIFAGLEWLGLDQDAAPTFQFERADRHREVVQLLLDKGLAYQCFATPEELAEMREAQKAAGKPLGYDGRWRGKAPSDAPPDRTPAIRFKAPQTDETTIADLVQGDVTIPNETLDDLVILRADGTPTYNLAVVVDDHDMGVTHVIRGDDHLTNAFRQFQIYKALDWHPPKFAHIPLIHGADGAKLSKRHGALGVEAYRDMGYLAEGMRNYLLRLGWSHGDVELLTTHEAINLFDTSGLGRAPARLDLAKLDSVNAHHMRQLSPEHLAEQSIVFLEKLLGRTLNADDAALWQGAAQTVVERAHNFKELAEKGQFYFAQRPLTLEDKARKAVEKAAPDVLRALMTDLDTLDKWTPETVQKSLQSIAEKLDIGFGKVAQPLRGAVCGTMASPGLSDVLAVLGKEETLARLKDQIPDH